MHSLKYVEIHNFRSCENVSLRLNSFTPLVGYNNAGKSNILFAIKWILSPYSLQSSDFYDEQNPICVTALIEGVSDDILNSLQSRHQAKIQEFVSNEQIWIRQRQNTPGQKKSDINLEIYKPHQGSSGEWNKNPSGIRQAIEALFPEPIDIGAMEDATEDSTKAKAGTTIGRLLALFIDPLHEQYGQVVGNKLQEIDRLINQDEDSRPEILKEFDKNVDRILSEFFPGVNVQLHVPVPDARKLFQSGTVKVREPNFGEQLDMADLGHGSQRSIQIALIRYFSEIRSQIASDSRRQVLLVEEPELYLHPQAVEKVRIALYRLSRSSYQVIFATHSPMMISRTHIPYTAVVRKSEPGRTFIANNLAKSLEEQAIDPNMTLQKVLMELKNSSKWLFSDKVLLVEGKTELVVLPALYEKITGFTLEDCGISILHSGKGSMGLAKDLLSDMGIAARGITDLDHIFDASVKRGIIAENDENLQRCLQGFVDISMDTYPVQLNEAGSPRNPRSGEQGLTQREAVEYLALRGDCSSAIDRLRDVHKQNGIWFWRYGDIEVVLNLNKKDEAAWEEFAYAVERTENWKQHVNYWEEVNSFVEWLSEADWGLP